MKGAKAPQDNDTIPQPPRPFSPFIVRTKKSLGQHFLVDRRALTKVVRAAELKASDLVVEVGPGLGVLTRELVRRAGWVIAVELDQGLAQNLGEVFAGHTNISIIHGDILKLSPEDLVKQMGLPIAEREKPQEAEFYPYKVVANLPYYITSPVLRHFLEEPYRPTMMVVMVQKEVAESITASPGDMGLLSVAVQFYGKARVIAYVPPASFRPPPKVESAVVRIDVYPEPPWAVPSVEEFFRVVRAGFGSRRKQLHNALAKGLSLSPGETAAILNAVGIDPSRRAQTLGLEEWARISWALAQGGEQDT